MNKKLQEIIVNTNPRVYIPKNEYTDKALRRFFGKIKFQGKCWNWTDCIPPSGYGVFYYKPTGQMAAHRFSYMMFKDKLPKLPMVIDHICRNRSCVNPEHLRTITSAENVLIGVGFTAKNKAKDRCSKGHLYIPENIQKTKSHERRNWRVCKKCNSENHSQWYFKKKSERPILLSTTTPDGDNQ